MKKFAIHIAVIFAGMLLIMVALDYVYTKIYEESSPRSKFQALRSYQGTKVDYIFLGSSRVENGIVPEIVEKKTGKSVFNAGFTASKLVDIYTILKLIKEYNIKTEVILIQIDNIFDIDGHSNTLPYQMAPFINDNHETKEYFNSVVSEPLYTVPFYRYCVYDHKIGVRELALNFSEMGTSGFENRGYSPVYGNKVNSTYKLPERIRLRNPVYEKILAHCSENKIEVIFYCAPYWKGTKNMEYTDKLEERVIGLKNYSRVVVDPALFKNNPHLNDKGARLFTEKLVDDLLLGGNLQQRKN